MYTIFIIWKLSFILYILFSGQPHSCPGQKMPSNNCGYTYCQWKNADSSAYYMLLGLYNVNVLHSLCTMYIWRWSLFCASDEKQVYTIHTVKSKAPKLTGIYGPIPLGFPYLRCAPVYWYIMSSGHCLAFHLYYPRASYIKYLEWIFVFFLFFLLDGCAYETLYVLFFFWRGEKFLFTFD